MSKIWIDVEDFFVYLSGKHRPSGIQRLAYELYRALVILDEGRGQVRFVRHDPLRKSFRSVAWEDVRALFVQFADEEIEEAEKEPPPPSPRRAALRRQVKKLAYRFPPAIRYPLLEMLVHERAALYSAGALLRGLVTAWRPQSVPGAKKTVPAPGPTGANDGAEALPLAPPVASDSFAREARPGDVLAMLASTWFHPDYKGVIKKACQDKGMRFAALVYDLIPVMRPEWCDVGLTKMFAAWVQNVLPAADVVLTISKSSAADITRYAAAQGMALRSPPVPLPVGTGFEQATRIRKESLRDLPAPGSYALVVSTVEVRKNHALLLRVWRRLLEEMPRESVPTLVFAGRIGWLVQDLIGQLENCDYLDGKIVVIENPTDAELERLYQGCMFTLFPSFYEGWGLPVTESLAFGRPCLISNTTSLPEAGGDLARYFDPGNTAEAYTMIREAIEDKEGLRAWEERVAREFRPVPWTDSARALLRACGLEASFGEARSKERLGQAVDVP